jgi:hypothetical protein
MTEDHLCAYLRPDETVDELRRAFFANVAVDASGCWFWRGKRDAYGSFRGKPAHCVSWEMHQGPIPEGLFILHGCSIAVLHQLATMALELANEADPEGLVKLEVRS